jgi:hypothetical protein
MVGSNSGDSSAGDSSFFASLKNCEGCAKRKEYLQTMLTDSRFWVGVLIGVGGTWAYHKYVKKG